MGDEGFIVRNFSWRSVTISQKEMDERGLVWGNEELAVYPEELLENSLSCIFFFSFG